ncbi:hypothetical protein GCM10023210_31150 [Chryseobacterium ginsengisoli]|uniref:Uncharacterized protein n=1 Tax=Chryseobacterium ginsengisoli TaxID=363853 RepID=A0ABP9MKG4_9FLAO
MNLIEKIKKFENDLDYFQILTTIYFSLPEQDYNEFEKQLEKAESENKKIFIDDSDLVGVLYDGILISMIKIK